MLVPNVMVAALNDTEEFSLWRYVTTEPHGIVGALLTFASGMQTLSGLLMLGGPGIPLTRVQLCRLWILKPRARSWLRKLHRLQGRLLLCGGASQCCLGAYTFAYRLRHITQPRHPRAIMTVVMGWFLFVVLVSLALFRRRRRLQQLGSISFLVDMSGPRRGAAYATFASSNSALSSTSNDPFLASNDH